jgi:hypothetical protein
MFQDMLKDLPEPLKNEVVELGLKFKQMWDTEGYSDYGYMYVAYSIAVDKGEMTQPQADCCIKYLEALHKSWEA